MTLLGNGDDLAMLPLHEIDFAAMPRGAAADRQLRREVGRDHVDYIGTKPVPMRDATPGAASRAIERDRARGVGRARPARLRPRRPARRRRRRAVGDRRQPELRHLARRRRRARAAAVAGLDYPALIERIALAGVAAAAGPRVACATTAIVGARRRAATIARRSRRRSRSDATFRADEVAVALELIDAGARRRPATTRCGSPSSTGPVAGYICFGRDADDRARPGTCTGSSSTPAARGRGVAGALIARDGGRARRARGGGQVRVETSRPRATGRRARCTSRLRLSGRGAPRRLLRPGRRPDHLLQVAVALGLDSSREPAQLLLQAEARQAEQARRDGLVALRAAPSPPSM